MTILTIILFGCVVLIAHFLEGITGFGCTVIALPFCALLVGIKTSVPVLTALGVILSFYIIIVDFKSIVWKEYFRIIAFVGVGLPFGMMIFRYLPESTLKRILGIFMILVAARGIYTSFKGAASDRPINKYVLNVILFLGGIIHGAFSTGGPFIVIYATQALKNKKNFRATLSTLWATLNTVIVIKTIYSGVFTTPVIKMFLYSVPFLIVGMLLGNWAHNKIKDTVFTKMVYIVLFISGFFMFM